MDFVSESFSDAVGSAAAGAFRQARRDHSGQWPEFIRSCRERGVDLDFIDPGRPMQNGHVASFNGRFRDECLSQAWFVDLDDASASIEAWPHDGNTRRAHSALRNILPQVFLDRFHAGLLPLGHVASDLAIVAGRRIGVRSRNATEIPFTRFRAYPGARQEAAARLAKFCRPLHEA